jgi:hypothetical protein
MKPSDTSNVISSKAQLKVRAIQAREKLREIGINYCIQITKANPELKKERVYCVANGVLSDERITLLLEDLVSKHCKAVA